MDFLDFSVQDEIRYLVSFGDEKYDFIYNSIRYLKEVKSSITYVISPNYSKIEVQSNDSLPLEKMLML